MKNQKNNLIEKFKELEDSLNISFANKDLLITAFVHRSFVNENKWLDLPHNERLEFLGDAVLELVTTKYLYNNFNKDEGVLTVWRSSLVNTTMLSQKGEELNFMEYLLLSKGEQKGSDKSKQYILADVYEAFVGALYLDKGFDACEQFINATLIKPEIESTVKKGAFLDAKSHFQERAQEIEKTTPIYKVLKEWGPDHDKHFKIGVFLNDELIADGEGLSKKEAEEAAAQKAFEIKGW